MGQSIPFSIKASKSPYLNHIQDIPLKMQQLPPQPQGQPQAQPQVPPLPQPPSIANVLAESKMFEWAGVGLGEENWLLISNAVKVFNKYLK